MASNPNLDALIPREDFEIMSDNPQSQFVQTIQIRDLEPASFFYEAIRKPDFQRETASWDPRKITEFVQSFLEGDLIPAIILWNASGFNFVIDGAHRISALIAWVHDDYGDGSTSRNFFGDRIPEEQKRAAELTRDLINKSIGSYEDHKTAIRDQARASSETLDRAKKLASLALQLQWVTGNAAKAEASFFKINQQAAPIDQTELTLIKTRRSPNAIAARAIMRAGTGHKYWSEFNGTTQTRIEKVARDINRILFSPALTNPLKSLDLPIGGQGYSTQSLSTIFDLVNLINLENYLGRSDIKSAEYLGVDHTGEETLTFLQNTINIMNRIAGTHASCLGLHPVVYFYNAKGRFQPTAFFAVIRLIKSFEHSEDFKRFTKARFEFERFLELHNDFTNQIALKTGSGIRGSKRLHELYLLVIHCISQGQTQEKILQTVMADERFNFLTPSYDEELPEYGREFDTDTKSSVFLREALRNPIRCGICNGLIDSKSMTIDHIQRKQDGGTGKPDNGQLAHPYCNNQYKN